MNDSIRQLYEKSNFSPIENRPSAEKDFLVKFIELCGYYDYPFPIIENAIIFEFSLHKKNIRLCQEESNNSTSQDKDS